MLVIVVTAPDADMLMPAPAAMDDEAVQVGAPESQPSTWPLVPPVTVSAEAAEPITEMALERLRTPDAVSDVVAVLWKAVAPP